MLMPCPFCVRPVCLRPDVTEEIGFVAFSRNFSREEYSWSDIVHKWNHTDPEIRENWSNPRAAAERAMQAVYAARRARRHLAYPSEECLTCTYGGDCGS